MRKLLLLSAAFLALTQSALFADTYLVTIDTSSILGETGSLEVGFNPYPGGGQPAGLATVTGFTIVGGTLGSETYTAFITGSLPGPLEIQNIDFFNGAGYDATFGSLVRFYVEFSGDAYTGPATTVLTDFYVGLYGSSAIFAQATLLGGGVLDTSFSSPGVTFAGASAAVPEPSAYAVFLIGFGMACRGTLRLLARRTGL